MTLVGAELDAGDVFEANYSLFSSAYDEGFTKACGVVPVLEGLTATADDETRHELADEGVHGID